MSHFASVFLEEGQPGVVMFVVSPDRRLRFVLDESFAREMKRAASKKGP